MNRKFRVDLYWLASTLVISLAVSVLAWQYTLEVVTRQETEQFQFMASEKITAITEAMDKEVLRLQGGAGYFYGSEEVTREDWQTYTETLRDSSNFSAIQGFGLSVWLAPEDIEAHVQQVRAEGFQDYQVTPEGEREEYTAIIYLEPFDERNQRAFGYDMFSEPVRREAMERARDTGKAALSGRVTLVQETEIDVQAGFLMYVPVYRKGSPVDSIEERRASLYGYVYSPFRARNLLSGIFPDGFPYTHVQVFDGLQTTQESLLFDSLAGGDLLQDQQSSLYQETVIEFAGHPWTITVSPSPAFTGLVEGNLPWFVLGGGILLSLGLSLLVWLERQSRFKARQLELSEGQMSATLHSIGDGVISTDTMGRITDINHVSEYLTGWTLKEAMGRPIGDVFYIINERTRNPAPIPVDDVLTTGEVHGLANHTVLIARDGTERAIADSAAPIRDKNGNILGVVLVFRDVSEEQRLELDQIRLAEIVNSSDDAIISSSLDGIITSWNPGAEQLFGYTATEIIGSPTTLLCPEDLLEEESQILERLEKGEHVDHFESVRVTKGGNHFEASVNISAMIDNEGDIVGISKIIRDITEYKQAQKELTQFNTKLEQLVQKRTAALSEQKALLQAMLENLAEGVVACDADGRLTLFNKAARQWYDIDPRDVPRESLSAYYDLFEEDGITPLSVDRIPLLRAIKGETVIDAQMCIAVRGKPPRHILASGGPIYDTEGLLLGATVVMNDITERLASMEEMKRALMILDSTDDGAFIFDAETFVYSYVNQGGIRQVGYTLEELVQMTPLDIVPQFSLETFQNVLDAFLKESNKFLNIRHKDGHYVPVEINLHLTHSENERPTYIAIVRDVTERKKAEDAIRTLNRDLEVRIRERTQELELARNAAESANRAKSSFLATMSHEIRTPMNGIIGTIDVLRQSSLRPRQKEQADIIKDSAYGLLSVIDDVLDFSKIEADKIILEREPIVLSNLIESICNAVRPIATKNNVRLNFYRAPSLTKAIVSDSVRLRQIITNLVSNAIKFSGAEDKQGQVDVRFLNKKTDQLLITIKDNGIGMPEGALRTIFNAFSQADISTTRRFGGTGLGLPICQRLVELMGGTIEVKSEIGVGSLFTVNLPIEVATITVEPEFSQHLKNVVCCLYTDSASERSDWNNWLQQLGATVHQLDKPEDVIALNDVKNPENKKIVVIAVDDITSVNDYLLLSQGQDLKNLSNLIIVRAFLSERAEIINDKLALVDRHPNICSSLNYVLSVIAGDKSIWTEETEYENSNSEPLTIIDKTHAAELGRLVLVAEDNEINQKVIASQLELLNYAYDIADDGQKALEMWSKNKYSLLLTDLHMPVMDGYELTKEIRSRETEDQHLTILAFTANATKGEKSRCIEAGMDDYLSKPIPFEVLKERLGLWTSKIEKSKKEISEMDVMQSKKILDISILKNYIGDNSELMEELISDYAESLLKTGAEIKAAFQAKNWSRIAELAHTLKSPSLAVGAMLMGELCKKLEAASKEANGMLIEEILPVFEQTMKELLDALSAQQKK